MSISMRIGLVIVIVLLSIWISYQLFRGYLEGRLAQNLWKGLLAEAVSDGYEGMYAVACVVRNRLEIGMNDGLDGLKRKDLDEFVARQPKRLQLKAKLIVRKVFEYRCKDVTNGAIYFMSRLSGWALNLKYCCKIGSHTFLKERENK